MSSSATPHHGFWRRAKAFSWLMRASLAGRPPRLEEAVLARGYTLKADTLAASARRYGAPATPDTAPLRINFILNALSNAGGVQSVVQLANDLAALGHETRLLVRSRQERVLSEPLRAELCFYPRLGALIRAAADCDIAVATFWPTMYLVAEAHLRRPCFLPAYFVQDYEPFFYPEDPALAAAARATYQLTPHAFAKTQWIAERVREAGGNVSIVPPSLDLSRFTVASGAPQSLAVLTLLRPGLPRRGYATALAVLRVLHRTRPDVELHAFGADDAELRAAGCDVPLVNHGIVPNQNLPDVYRSASVFLECSEFHGFGRTVAEAMACGTPVVATQSGGVEGTIAHEVNGLLAPPGDVDALAAAVLRLLDSPGDRNRFATRALETVRKFDRMHSARETLAVLHSFFVESRREKQGS